MYRTNFINDVVASIGWGLLTVVSTLLLTRNVTSVFGWTGPEILFLVAWFNITAGVFHLFFSRNFERMGQVIHKGELDLILLKPLNSQFLLSSWIMSLHSIIRVIIGVILTLFIIYFYHLPVTWGSFFSGIPFMLFGVAILYAVWFMAMTICVWNSQLSNIVNLLYSLNTLLKYPIEAYREMNIIIFMIVLPYALLVSTPTKIILGRWNMFELVGMMVISVCMVWASHLFWNFALRSYTSAS